MRLPAENIKAAREVQLVDFLNTYRPGELVRKSRDEYCTKSHSSLRITPSKNLFHWCSQSKGGRGALDYLLTVEGMSFRSAVMLLNEMELVPFQQVRVATVESSRTHDFISGCIAGRWNAGKRWTAFTACTIRKAVPTAGRCALCLSAILL